MNPGPVPADSPVEAVGGHARRYAATGGTDGHDWNGAPVLLLSVIGRRTGTWHRTPLIYGRAAGDYIVVASALGAPGNPAWYLNLTASPGSPCRSATRSSPPSPAPSPAPAERPCGTSWPAYGPRTWNTRPRPRG